MVTRALIIGAAALAGLTVAVGTVAAQEGRAMLVLQASAPLPPLPPAPPAPPEPPRMGRPPAPPLAPLRPMAQVDAELAAARDRLRDAARAYAEAVRARGGAHAAADGRIMLHEMDEDCRVAVGADERRGCHVVVLEGENLSREDIDNLARRARQGAGRAMDGARNVRIYSHELRLDREQQDAAVRDALAEARAARHAAEAVRREMEALRPQIEAARREAERAGR